MIDLPATIETQAAAGLQRPAIVAPAPRQISFGLVRGRVGPGTARVIVTVAGEQAAEVPVSGRIFRVRVRLPLRDVSVRVTAVSSSGARAATVVRPVFGLPYAARPGFFRSREDRVLARRLRALLSAYAGTTAAYVQNLRSGRGAAWNARARFPAASTLKLGIAVETLRRLSRPPSTSGWLGSRFSRMLTESDNLSANELLIWLGGSISSGAARVNSTLRALGINDSLMYGGYALGTAAGRPIPLRVESQPAFGLGKYTTAWDLSRIHRFVHLASSGRGPLLRVGGFSRADARFLLWTLLHVRDPGKLERYVEGPGVAVEHKAGWITTSRHDSGIVFSGTGAFVAVVMTWRPWGTSSSSDVLAGRVARAALRRFGETRARDVVVTPLVFHL